VGTKARGSIGKLCSQACSKGSNDINKLVLHNKKAKFACGQSSFQKDPDGIMGCYFSSKSSSKIIS
jgi:hypothetical protein